MAGRLVLVILLSCVISLVDASAFTGTRMRKAHSGVPLIMTWDTRNTSAGSSASNQIRLPLVNGGSYSFTVDWGDGTQSQILAWNDVNATHTYATAGVKTVKIGGTFSRFYFNNGGDKLKILNISQWGSNKYSSMRFAFYGCDNLTATASDTADVSQVQDFSGTFLYATNFNGNISDWNTANATDMSQMFAEAKAFNQPIGAWNTSNVTNMSSMFQGANNFNQPIGTWNTTSVTNMSNMFFWASAFNQSLSSWNTGSVTNMSNMFNSASAFNGAIGLWNTASVMDMNNMFHSASAFNQSIGSWNTASVVNMAYMFRFANSFNQPLSGWNVSSVTNMSNMFDSYTYNQNLTGWSVNPNVVLCSNFSANGAWSTIPSFSNCTP